MCACVCAHTCACVQAHMRTVLYAINLKSNCVANSSLLSVWVHSGCFPSTDVFLVVQQEGEKQGALLGDSPKVSHLIS